jgi:hypothetical protein
LIGPHVCLIERNAAGVGRDFEFVQGCCYLVVGVSPPDQIIPQKINLNGPVVFPLVPVAEVFVSQAVGMTLVGKQFNDSVLGGPFRAGCSGMAASSHDEKQAPADLGNHAASPMPQHGRAGWTVQHAA